MSSTVPTARAWLHAQLTALQSSTLTGVLVVDTGQWDRTSAMDQIVLRLPADVTRDQMMGAQRQESYQLPVLIAARTHSSTLADAESRFWALVTAVEDVFAASIANRTFGGVVASATPAGIIELEAGPVADGGASGGPVDMVCQGVLLVDVIARI